MNRAFNFNPGPCGLPDTVMQKAQSEFLTYRDEQTSVMEISHRGASFMDVYERAEAALRRLMNISDEYAVLFLAGGATGCAASVPMNLIADEKQNAAYIVSGHWSRRAADEAAKFCQMEVVADTVDSNYTILPTNFSVAENATYLHYAANETIHGVEFFNPPSSSVPLVADMSSNILSQPININDYGVVYAGAQKNLGPTGITVIIVRKSLIKPRRQTPLVWDYSLQIKSESMANTPPTFPIYMMGLVLEWIEEQGGAVEMEKRRREKSELLYQCIDDEGFYNNPVAVDCRSQMNVPFFLADDSLTAEFLAGAEENHLIGLKGHAVLGGCRASLYNAMPLEGVRLLVEYMRDFAKRRG